MRFSLKLRLEAGLEVNDKAIDNLVSEGVTAPRGAPAAYALVFETKSDPNGTFPLHLILSVVSSHG
ncbi:hypothetical protein CU276_01360 [Yersinia kristensenii]|nr:hypothetical protein CU276_01360 [Yersinia kristensenii]